MEKTTELYRRMHENNVILIDRHLPFSCKDTKAATIYLRSDGTYGIFMDSSRIETTAEENAIILHECGHCATGAMHEVCSACDLVEKHEYKANKWAVIEAISAEDLGKAVSDGCTDFWSLSDRFNLPVDFIRMAVCWYTYGNLAAELYL